MTDNEIKFREFYDFLYPKPVLENEESQEYKKGWKEFEDGIDILYKKTEKFSKTDESILLEIIKSLSKEEFEKVFQVFRIFTAVSRMSIITYVNSSLISGDIFKPLISTKSNGEPKGRKIKFKNQEYSMPDYNKLILMAQDHSEIRSAFLDLFIDNNLIKNLSIQKNQNIVEIKKISKIAFKYSQKGSIAAESGKTAEKIVRDKIKAWGMEQNIINSVDESLIKILENKLNSLLELKEISTKEFEMKKKILERKKTEKKSARQFDLVFDDPNNFKNLNIPNKDTRKNSKVIVQVVFFTSNTGSEEKKKRNQNIHTNKIIKEIIPNYQKHLKNLLFLDGPGWITMSGGFQKTKETGDDFFQIKTTDTKLKNTLNLEGYVFPIDIEIAILECRKEGIKAEKEIILQRIHQKKHISASEEEILCQNELFLLKIEKERVLEIPMGDEKITEKFMFLEKLQYVESLKGAIKYKIIHPNNKNYEISDQSIMDDFKKIGYDELEIISKLKEISDDGTIIMRFV
jgi:hypothetical protein